MSFLRPTKMRIQLKCCRITDTVDTEAELEAVWRASQNGSSKDVCSSRRGTGSGVKTPKMTALMGQYHHVTTARIKLL
jgi:hypothetical protein